MNRDIYTAVLVRMERSPLTGTFTNPKQASRGLLVSPHLMRLLRRLGRRVIQPLVALIARIIRVLVRPRRRALPLSSSCITAIPRRRDEALGSRRHREHIVRVRHTTTPGLPSPTAAAPAATSQEQPNGDEDAEDDPPPVFRYEQRLGLSGSEGRVLLLRGGEECVLR